MSHNVSMTGIPLKDMNILQMALAELNKDHSTQFKLLVGDHPSRNYGGKRKPPNTVAVITDPNFNYDVSIQCKDGEYSVQAEALLIRPLMDAFKVPTQAMNVSTGKKVELANTRYGNNEAVGLSAAIGPITQRYSLLMAERQAAMQGHTYRRQHDKATGVISLVATVK